MNGCTINSKDHCRESRAHGVAKTYYLHKLLYQNIRSFLLNDILVILVKNILVRSTTTVHAGGSRRSSGIFSHLVGSERLLAVGRSRLLFPFLPLLLLHLKGDRRLQHSYPTLVLHDHRLQFPYLFSAFLQQLLLQSSEM